PITFSRFVVADIEQRVQSFKDKRFVFRLNRLNHFYSPVCSKCCSGQWCANHKAVLPPSTAIVAPVMKDALSDDRNTIDSAISSGLPTRLSGTPALKPAFLSS